MCKTTNTTVVPFTDLDCVCVAEARHALLSLRLVDPELQEEVGVEGAAEHDSQQLLLHFVAHRLALEVGQTRHSDLVVLQTPLEIHDLRANLCM